MNVKFRFRKGCQRKIRPDQLHSHVHCKLLHIRILAGVVFYIPEQLVLFHRNHNEIEGLSYFQRCRMYESKCLDGQACAGCDGIFL